MNTERPSGWVRDHLANERTYLSWLRTGIALMGLGFVIAKLGIDLPVRSPVSPKAILHSGGVAFFFVGGGLLVVVFGTWRFLAVERMIRQADFRPLGYRALLISGAFLLIGVAVLVYLWGKAV